MPKHFGGNLVTLAVVVALLAMALPLGFACRGTPPPAAAFNAYPLSGPSPLEVQFTDQSTGKITHWLWDFGDGEGSIEQNPSHTYEAPGIYTVSLEVTGPGGSDIETKLGYIEVAMGKPVINIGILTDITGPAHPAMIPILYAVEDLVRYINEEDPIPGVEIKIVTYDTKSDPVRDLAGYNWCREQGAKVIVTPVPSSGETLKQPFAERDKVPILSLAATLLLIEPPGWVFCFNSPASYQMETLLKWISEEHWDYEGSGRVPKVGLVGWSEPYSIELREGMEEYCRDHPDKFEYAGGYLIPVGGMLWGGEVEALKDCDYICTPTGIAVATFIKDFQDRGYSSTFIGSDALSGYQGFLVDSRGWEALDGILTAHSALWWNEASPLVDLAKELLYRYRPGDAEEIIYSGGGYIGGFQQAYLFFEILRAAVEEVGAENFDGQAFYDTAVGFQATYEGYPEWAFTETKRYVSEHVPIYEWSAEVEDLVRITDWLTIITD